MVISLLAAIIVIGVFSIYQAKQVYDLRATVRVREELIDQLQGLLGE